MTTQTTEQTPEQQEQTSVVAKVLALVAAYEAGRITAETFIATAAAIVYAGKVLAARSADILISTLSHARPRGIAPDPRGHIRLQRAFRTIIDEGQEEPESLVTRAERVAVAEPLHEERRALQEAMREQGFTQWQRAVHEDACEVCAPLAGEVHDISRGFTDHPGCRCTLRPFGEPQTPEPEPEQRLVRITKTITYR